MYSSQYVAAIALIFIALSEIPFAAASLFTNAVYIILAYNVMSGMPGLYKVFICMEQIWHC